jgi:transcriptional regulator with XRE-family HTH domain
MDNNRAAKSIVSEAVRALRIAIGDTQQQFASRLKMAISTVVRYELTRPPSGPVLVQFMELAETSNRPDLAEIFRKTLADSLGGHVPQGEQLSDFSHRLNKARLLSLFENNGEKWLSAEFAKLISAAKAGRTLVHPTIYNEDGTAAHEMQIDYLESIVRDVKSLEPLSESRSKSKRVSSRKGRKK